MAWTMVTAQEAQAAYNVARARGFRDIPLPRAEAMLLAAFKSEFVSPEDFELIVMLNALGKQISMN